MMHGCRCPEGWLLQDYGCVPVGACRCGLPSSDLSSEYEPGHVLDVDCNQCTCTNGTFVCTERLCPTFGPWNPWNPCSLPCGGGHRERQRQCHSNGSPWPCHGERVQHDDCNTQPCADKCVLSEWEMWSSCSSSCGGGITFRNRSLEGANLAASTLVCDETLIERRSCNNHNCSSDQCPEGQVYSICANTCPALCADLSANTACLFEGCLPGCRCPADQVLQDGKCISRDVCRCLITPSVPRWAFIAAHGVSEHAPGTVFTHKCNNCTCRRGAFDCTAQACQGEQFNT
uniref:SCO-spondin n=1 Tax=Eptatretus burgeri TaxID=7764 RepID=A0A8C4R5F5_EPTBU